MERHHHPADHHRTVFPMQPVVAASVEPLDREQLIPRQDRERVREARRTVDPREILAGVEARAPKQERAGPAMRDAVLERAARQQRDPRDAGAPDAGKAARQAEPRRLPDPIGRVDDGRPRASKHGRGVVERVGAPIRVADRVEDEVVRRQRHRVAMLDHQRVQPDPVVGEDQPRRDVAAARGNELEHAQRRRIVAPIRRADQRARRKAARAVIGGEILVDPVQQVGEALMGFRDVAVDRERRLVMQARLVGAPGTPKQMGEVDPRAGIRRMSDDGLAVGHERSAAMAGPDHQRAEIGERPTMAEIGFEHGEIGVPRTVGPPHPVEPAGPLEQRCRPMRPRRQASPEGRRDGGHVRRRNRLAGRTWLDDRHPRSSLTITLTRRLS